MKKLFKIGTFLWMVASACFASGSESIRAFRGKRGQVLFVDAENKQKVMIAGGAISNGAATAGDCFAEAYVSLKKAPNYYEGNFVSVRNDLTSVTDDEVKDKGIGFYLTVNQIRIGGAETSDMCADRVDFSGDYSEWQKGSREYKEEFVYFMGLAHQNANYLFARKNSREALAELRPFIEAYDRTWLKSVHDRKTLIAAINDYAFLLQDLGRNTEAMPLLLLVTQHEPGRTVAWLNLGDAYWAESQSVNAAKCYAEYIKQMRVSGLTRKIPERALERETGRR